MRYHIRFHRPGPADSGQDTWLRLTLNVHDGEDTMVLCTVLTSTLPLKQARLDCQLKLKA